MPAFLLEVGTEELPASFVASACQQWRDNIPLSLADASLPVGAIAVYGTPRRLAVVIHDLPDRQADQRETVKGPPAKAAFKDGKPTPAAIGFARKYGADVDSLTIQSTDKGDFVFLDHEMMGRPTAEVLAELAPGWITGLDGKRFMRWSDGELRFSRPIRWLVALWDDAVLPLSITVRAATDTVPAEILTADRQSRGHRVLHPEPVVLATATDYGEQMRSAFVIVNAAERETMIRSQVEAQAKTLGGTAAIDPKLLAEVRDLAEYPTAIVGQFDAEFLALPAEVTTTVMAVHQRYFPVLDSAGQLLPHFIAVSNGDPAKAAAIAAGNGRVIRARLSDGQFFYRADTQRSLESFLPDLETVTFQQDLGSMRAKVERIVARATGLCDQLQIQGQERTDVLRAALLCKADLVTQMVYEFPELQGVMGEKYARSSGETATVAIAIAEHYLPKGAGDPLPTSTAGKIVGLADRLDTLVGIFSLGMIPSGSSDPFALRRAANAVLNMLWEARWPLDLGAAIATETNAPDPALATFLVQRVRSLLQDEQGLDYDLANAIAAEDDPEAAQRVLRDPLDALVRGNLLQTLRDSGELALIYETINRATRLAAKGDLATQLIDPQSCIDTSLCRKVSEQAFYDGLTELAPKTESALRDRNYEQLIAGLTQIAPVVADFFDGSNSVLVMDEDPKIRRNRLNLLGLLRNHARVLADFGAIVKDVDL